MPNVQYVLNVNAAAIYIYIYIYSCSPQYNLPCSGNVAAIRSGHNKKKQTGNRNTKKENDMH